MTEPMFDPVQFPPPAEQRRAKIKVHPDHAERVDDDPRWRMIATRRGVDPVAHLVVIDHVALGLTAVALCGRVRGRGLELCGTRPTACPLCLVRRKKQEEGESDAASD